MTNTAWGWLKITEGYGQASIPCIQHSAGNRREQLPAHSLLPRHLPLCSYSEILQLQLPYLVAGTVLCLAEPPGPRRPRLGPARLQRATPAGPRASRGHAHVRSSSRAGRAGLRPGLPPREHGRSSPSRPGCVCKPLAARQRKMKRWSSSVKTQRFLSCFPLFFRTGYSVSCGDFTGAFCREKESLNTALKNVTILLCYVKKQSKTSFTLKIPWNF